MQPAPRRRSVLSVAFTLSLGLHLLLLALPLRVPQDAPARPSSPVRVALHAAAPPPPPAASPAPPPAPNPVLPLSDDAPARAPEGTSAPPAATVSDPAPAPRLADGFLQRSRALVRRLDLGPEQPQRFHPLYAEQPIAPAPAEVPGRFGDRVLWHDSFGELQMQVGETCYRVVPAFPMDRDSPYILWRQRGCPDQD